MKSLKGFTLVQLMVVMAIVAMLAVLVIPVVAGSVYDRAIGTATAGAATWTNQSDYAAIVLKRIWIIDNKSTSATVTVTRATSDGTYTQAVGSVACTSGDGSTTSFTASYLKDGDKLIFANSAASNATYMIEYEFQQH